MEYSGSLTNQPGSEIHVTLAACIEWSLLQVIGAKVRSTGNLSRTGPPINIESESPVAILGLVDNKIAFLETALRHLLLEWKALPSRCPRRTLDEFQENLRHLCRQLDRFANPAFTASDPASATNTDTYDNLRAIQKFLVNRPKDSETWVINLVMAASTNALPGTHAIFLIPDTRVGEMLSAAGICNSFIKDILLGGDTADGCPQSLAPSTLGGPSDSAFGYRANAVLESLFKHFHRFCTSVHDVRLLLSDDFGATSGSSSPGALQMLLSGCSCAGKWHETECWPYGEALQQDYRAIMIDNLCKNLQDREVNITLILFLEHHGIFSAVHRLGDSVQPLSQAILQERSLQSLENLIQSGAFLPPRLANSRTPIRFGPKQKDRLALKLAHCLADFSFASLATPKWDGKFIIAGPSERSGDPKLYMTFTTSSEEISFVSTDNDVQFQVLDLSEPARLSFAKLILEIYNGEPIDLDCFKSVPDQLAELCKQIHQIQRGEGGDLYAEALKSTIIFDVVSSKPRPGESPVQAFRRTVRDKIAKQLEKVAVPDGHCPVSESAASGDWNTMHFSQKSRSTPRCTQPTLTSQGIGQPATRPFHSASRRATAAPQKTPPGSRVTVFRAQQITIPVGKTVSEVVGEIVRARPIGSDKVEFKFAVKDVTKLLDKYYSRRTPRRGAAILYVRGDIPEDFRRLPTKNGITELMSAGDNDELSMEVDAHFLGSTQLYEPPSDIPTQADIVFIHGLNGHPCGSWLSKSAKPKLWPLDFLPEDFPDCRIILYGYNSNIFDDTMHPRHELVPQADRLNATLDNLRNNPETRKRPIIFIAHSYGGLILARTLIDAAARKKPLHSATAALFLMACPMRGFHVDDILGAIRAEQPELDIAQDKVQQLLHRLGDGDFFHSELLTFPNAVAGKKVFTFYEMDRTQTLTMNSGQPRRDGDSVRAAPPNLVILGFPEEDAVPAGKDHSSIVKFAFRSDETYQDIVCRIQQVLSELPSAEP